MDEFYRPIIGYDSIEIMGKFMDEDKLEINYCFPNQWERVKYQYDYQKDTAHHSEFDHYLTDTPYIVTAIDSQGTVISFIGSGIIIPPVDTTQYKIIKITKRRPE